MSQAVIDKAEKITKLKLLIRELEIRMDDVPETPKLIKALKDELKKEGDL